jgi:hypothetical protein
MKITIQELQEKFVALPQHEQRNICGGNALPLTNAQLIALFNFAAFDPSGKGNQTAGFNSEIGQYFTTEIELMASTPLGADIIKQLQTTGKQITLTDNDPLKKEGPGGAAAYFYYANGNPSTPAIDIKSLIGDDTMGFYQIETDFNVIAHEMFHAYESVALGIRNNQVGYEVDANLAAAFEEKQLDAKSPVNNFYGLGAEEYVKNPTTPAQIAFDNAWNGIVNSQQFTLSNYNTLINNFLGSLFNPEGLNSPTDPTKGYNDLSVIPLGISVNGDPLYTLFTKDVFDPYLSMSGTPSTSPSSYDSGGTSGLPIGASPSYSWNTSSGTTIQTAPTTVAPNGDPSMIWNPTTGWSTQIPPGATVPPGYIIITPSSPIYQHLDPTKPYLPSTPVNSPYTDPNAQQDDAPIASLDSYGDESYADSYGSGSYSDGGGNDDSGADGGYAGGGYDSYDYESYG